MALKAPWIRWYTALWVADTSHLSPLEEGVYSKLINHYYLNRGPLPSKPTELYRITHAFDEEEQQATRKIVAEFFELRGDPQIDGTYHHAKADEEINYSDSIYGAKVVAGYKTAWVRHGCMKSRARLEALGIDPPERDEKKGSASTPTSTPTSTPKRQLVEKEKEKENSSPKSVAPPAGVNETAWEEFEAHRKKMRQPMTGVARRKLWNKLLKLSTEEQIECIDLSIENRWRGIFPEKVKRNGTQKSNRPRTVTQQADETVQRFRERTAASN